MSTAVQPSVRPPDPETERRRAILLHLTASAYGGVETHVYYLAQSLRCAGADVTLVSQRRFELNGPWTQALKRIGVRIVIPPKVSERLPATLALLVTRMAIARKLRRKSFDRVVGQGHGGAFAWMRRFVRNDGLFIWHEHWYGLPTRGDSYATFRPPAPARFAPRMQRMVNKVDGIITGCERARRNLIEVQEVESPIRVIPPLDKMECVPEAVDRCYDRTSTLKFLMVARLGRGKGVMELLGLWKTLRIGPSELHFHGPISAEFERELRPFASDPSIHFHGPFERADLPRILQSFDAGLMLSIEEGYGLVAWEYMACGLPFVITDCGAAPEFTEGNPDAVMVPVSTDGVRAGIEEMANRLRAGLVSRQRLQSFFNRHFSFEKNAAEYIQALLGPSVYWRGPA